MTRREAVGHVNTQVAVIGAGPVGLLLAFELRRARVPVVIVERLASPMTESRASQLTTLTAQLLDERGFDGLLKEAAPEPRAHFGGLPLDLSLMDSQHAGNWKLPQFRTEAIIGQRAEELGATLLRDHELTQVRELADHVTCEVRGPAGRLRIHARYVVGCDGATSTVRQICGFSSSTTRPTRQMLRADVTGIAIKDRRFERLAGGLAVAGTRDGVTRVMVCATGQPVAEREGPPRFPEVARVWRQVTGEDISAGNAIWIDSFDNSTGQANEYRRGRVLLAGDAAHWHMPIGGQALNVGLQDAINLGWKLAGSVNGWAPPHLLDTYHDERHAVAARVIDYVTAQEIILFGGSEVEPLREVLAEIIGLDQVRDYLANVVSGLDDRYGPRDSQPSSPLVGRRIGHMRVRNGAGTPVMLGSLTGTTPAVVRLAPAAEAAFPIPTIYASPDDASFSTITSVLIRPDGYVAWAGNDEAELELAIGRWFSMRRNEGSGTV